MADDVLRMTASVRDDFSATLRKLQAELRNLAIDPTPTKIRKDWSAVGNEIKTIGSGLTNTFIPALRGVSLTSLGVSGAVLGAASALKNFADESTTSIRLTKELRLTNTRFVEELRLTGRRFGMDMDQIAGVMRTFQDNARKLHIGPTMDPRARAALINEFDALGVEVANKLANAGNIEEAWNAVVAILKREEPERARALSRALFGTDQIAIMVRNTSEQAAENIKRKAREITGASAEMAEKFNANWRDMNDAILAFRDEALVPVLPVVTNFLEVIRQPTGQWLTTWANELKTSLPPIAEALRNITDGNILQGIEKLAAAWGKWVASDHFVRKAVTGAAESAKAGLMPGGDTGAIPLPAPPKVAPSVPHVDGPTIAPGGPHTPLVDELARSQEKLKESTDRLNRTIERAIPPNLSTTPDPSNIGEGGGGGGGGLFNGLGGAIRRGIGGLFGRSAFAGGGGGGMAPLPDMGGVASGGGGIGPAGRGGAGMPFGPAGGAGAAGVNPAGRWWTQERVNFAVNYLKQNAGLSDMGAKGLVARWAGVEAPSGPGSVNPRSGAIGIAQWLGSRKPGTPADFEGQLSKAVGELKTTEGRARQTLMKARTPWEAAAGAAQFERAEGWSARTGVDNWVTKTIRTMNGIGAGGVTPPNLAPVPQATGIGRGNAPSSATVPQGAGGAAVPGSDPTGVHPDLMRVINRAKTMSEIPFHLHEGVRTAERQKEMVARGWSRTMNSRHLTGDAADLRAEGDAAEFSNTPAARERYAKINAAIQRAAREEGVPVEWGGNWRGFQDLPHFQLPKGYKRGALLDKAGETGVNGGSPSAKVDARGSVSITLSDSLRDKNVKTDTSGMFKDVRVGRGRSARPPENAPESLPVL